MIYLEKHNSSDGNVARNMIVERESCMKPKLGRGVPGAPLLVRSRAGCGKRALPAPCSQLWVQAVYDDRQSGLYAKEVFDALQQQFGPEVDCQLSLWRFDVLSNPALRLQAELAARQSDLVLLAAHGLEKLPAAVGLWMKAWLDGSAAELPALVLLLSAESIGNSQATVMVEELRRCADQAGVDMLHQFSRFPEQRHEQFLGLLHPEMLTLSSRAADPRFLRRHWGINE